MTTDFSRFALVLALVGAAGWALPASATGGDDTPEASAPEAAEVPKAERIAREWRSLPRKERVAREWRSLPRRERVARERRGLRPEGLGD